MRRRKYLRRPVGILSRSLSGGHSQALNRYLPILVLRVCARAGTHAALIGRRSSAGCRTVFQRMQRHDHGGGNSPWRKLGIAPRNDVQNLRAAGRRWLCSLRVTGGRSRSPFILRGQSESCHLARSPFSSFEPIISKPTHLIYLYFFCNHDTSLSIIHCCCSVAVDAGHHYRCDRRRDRSQSRPQSAISAAQTQHRRPLFKRRSSMVSLQSTFRLVCRPESKIGF